MQSHLRAALCCIRNMVACEMAKSLQLVRNSVPQMPLELISDVSSAQHCAMIDEVLVAPCAGPAGVLPPLPYVQEGDEISLPHCKSAQDALLVSHSAVVDSEYSAHCNAAHRQCKFQSQAARSPQKLPPRTLPARHNTSRSKWVSTGNAIMRCWFFSLGICARHLKMHC